MKTYSSLVVLLTSSILATGFTIEAKAESISIAITAEVAEVDDRNGLLSGAITAGDVITGTYVFDSSAPDTNLASTVGDYGHTTAPFGILLNAGGFVFRTDPNNVNFLVEIVNDHGIPGMDNYLLRSYNNIFDRFAPPDPSGPPVQNHIAWQLDDPTLAALSSDALPTVPPTLADWQSNIGLTIESRNSSFNGFFVRAHVTSAELIVPCSKKPKENRKKCKK